MTKFYVIHGYAGPDHYTSDNGPVLRVSVFDTAESVERFYLEWKEETDRPEKGNHVFRVIEGVERILRPVEKVVEFKLT